MTQPKAATLGDYGLIGDTRTAALVSPEGVIEWMCVPRFDSPPLFGQLVGGNEAGRFAVAPDEPAQVTERFYRGGSATVETVWSVEGGQLSVADSMIAGVTGSALPATTLVRRVSSRGRPIRVRVEMVPRFGYRREPSHRVRRHGSAVVTSRGEVVVSLDTDHPAAPLPDETTMTVAPGHPTTVVMTAAHRGPLFLVAPEAAAAAAARDERSWQNWSDSLVTGPDHREAVVRSYVTLRLLTYSPTGAPVAAPTTSLPEHVGGIRNWDYRYAWPRDASIGVAAFLDANRDDEASGFFAWLLHASRLDRPRLPALLSLDGRPAPRERVLTGWPGYRGSAPVRVGNGARVQHQLDGYGWVLDAAWQMTRRGHVLDNESWRAMRSFADYVERVWMEPDSGIWERRAAPRHHVHSKAMAWLALDRAIRVAESRGDSAPRAASWTEAKRRLGDEIQTEGYDPGTRSYTSAYGSRDTDASLLLLPRIGLEPQDSPRVRDTIERVRHELGAGGPLLYRYREDDGLPGGEGAFLPCSFWLVEALARVGERARAEDLFVSLLGLSGPLGLFAEEMDPSSHEHLGNFPQALTHAALIQAASALGDVSPAS